MASKAPMLGTGFRKIQPKLRMVANGSAQVNEVRADFSPAVQMAPSFSLSSPEAPSQIMAQVSFSTHEAKWAPKRGKLRELTDEIRVSVFVECDSARGLDSTPGRLPGMTSQDVTAKRGCYVSDYLTGITG